LRGDSPGFHATICLAGLEIFELLGSATGPLDHDPVDTVVLAEAEGEPKFRVGEIAGTTLHHPQPGNSAILDLQSGADRIPVGLSTGEAKTDAVIPRQLIVPEQVSGPVVGREKQIEVAVAIKISIGKAASDFGLAEIRTHIECGIAECSVASIEKQLRRLGVTYIAADVPNSVVDVSVGYDQIESAVEVQVGKHTPEAQHRLGWKSDPGANRHVVVDALPLGTIQSEHFIVEVGDGNPGNA